MAITGDPQPFLDLVIPEHANKPKFMAVVELVAQAFADIQAVADAMPGLFDLDVAVGDQLDKVGQWIGRTRSILIPISDTYFQFDTVGAGWDEGVWFGTGSPTANILELDDQHYRTLLLAVAIANQWDGTIPAAYAAWDRLFGPYGYTVGITDNQDMTMGMILIGPTPDTVTKALFEGGYLSLKPSGVEITSYTYRTS